LAEKMITQQRLAELAKVVYVEKEADGRYPDVDDAPPGSWLCVCGNVNWPFRLSCNKLDCGMWGLIMKSGLSDFWYYTGLSIYVLSARVAAGKSLCDLSNGWEGEAVGNWEYLLAYGGMLPDKHLVFIVLLDGSDYAGSGRGYK
ncbi:hypothetical protein FOZ62_012146, partial [Perkinsus olseni]